MAVMVKVLLPFQAEVNPPLNWNRLVLLIEFRRSLPKTSVLPGLRGLFSGGKSGAGEDCSHGDTKTRGKAGCGEAVVPPDEQRLVSRQECGEQKKQLAHAPSLNWSPRRTPALNYDFSPDISCMAWNIRPEGRYGLIPSGLPGLTPSEKWNNHFGFSVFPGRPCQVPFQKELGRGAYFTR
jgi:hypothetical protein